MKRIILILLAVILIVPLVFAGIGYAVLQYQYKDRFMPGMFINSTYAADMTVAELNDRLCNSEQIPDMVITDIDGKEHKISLDQVDYHVDYEKQIQKLKETQSVYSFVQWFLSDNSSPFDKQISPSFFYDQSKLEAILDKEKYLEDNSNCKGKVIEIRYNLRDGYYLYDETTNLLDHQKAVSTIEDALNQGIFDVDLVKSECYVQMDYTTAMKKTLKRWDNLSKYMNTDIKYDFDSYQRHINGAVIGDFLEKDENEDLVFDSLDKPVLLEDEVKKYMHDFAVENSTVNKPRQFHTTRGDVVTVQTGTYGNVINEKEEFEYVLSAIRTGKCEERKPSYSQTTFSGLSGYNDIGDTYIEVDLTNQKMYYYVNGKVKLETDVVTGNTSLGRGTPQKVCYVYFKQRNRTLRGEGYASFVNFWMAVYRGIGIHDASWRSKYGGKIYKTSGSHGCINTPYSKVSELYDMVEIGTPVIIFY